MCRLKPFLALIFQLKELLAALLEIDKKV